MKEIVLGWRESSKNGEELSETTRITLDDSMLLRLTAVCASDSRALYYFFPVIILVLIKPRMVQGFKN